MFCKSSEKRKIVVICGPTGIGKTAASVEMASCFHGEIISADSMQIYKYMDIGAAKPTPEEQLRVPHHLIGIVEPDQPFDAADFMTTADAVIGSLEKQNMMPFVAGGAGFYIKALIHGLFESEPNNPDIRNQLKETAGIKGTAYLYEQLRRYDPVKAQSVHPNDLYRIIRALEVCESTGKPMSRFHLDHGFRHVRYDALHIGIAMDREKLYERINARADLMIESGLLGEVQRLLDMGYSPGLKSMQSIGYRHMVGFIDGRTSWDESIRTLKRDTRRYAKRQMTWFKSNPDIIRIHHEDRDMMHRLIDAFRKADGW